MTDDPRPDDDAQPDDIALMLDVKQGDERAFEVLVERHQYRVVGTVAKMLGSETDAEDIAQQVFVRVWQSAARYNPSAKFTTWLLTITRNLVFNEMRRRRRSRLVPFLEDDSGHPLDKVADPGIHTASENMQEAELQNAIEQAIRALPEAQRMALVLRRFEGAPYEDIAGVLGTTVPAVKSLLFRARADLKERLKTHLQG